MSFAVIASDQEAPVSPDTDMADALAVAPRVANERGCKVAVIRNDSGDEVASFVPDSPPQPAAVEKPVESKKPADMTVAELDEAYGELEGYPSSENKDAKVKFAEAK